MAKIAKTKQLAAVRVEEEFAQEVANYTQSAKIDLAELQRRALRNYMDTNPILQENTDGKEAN
jgi:hypothetical protein